MFVKLAPSWKIGTITLSVPPSKLRFAIAIKVSRHKCSSTKSWSSKPTMVGSSRNAGWISMNTVSMMYFSLGQYNISQAMTNNGKFFERKRQLQFCSKCLKNKANCLLHVWCEGFSSGQWQMNAQYSRTMMRDRKAAISTIKQRQCKRRKTLPSKAGVLNQPFCAKSAAVMEAQVFRLVMIEWSKLLVTQ